MKKLSMVLVFLLAAALACALVFTGCGAQEQPAEAPGEGAVEDAPEEEYVEEEPMEEEPVEEAASFDLAGTEWVYSGALTPEGKQLYKDDIEALMGGDVFLEFFDDGTAIQSVSGSEGETHATYEMEGDEFYFISDSATSRGVFTDAGITLYAEDGSETYMVQLIYEDE